MLAADRKPLLTAACPPEPPSLLSRHSLPAHHLQVFKELQPGLNISRLTEADFLHFVSLATYCTRYVRLREVSGHRPSAGPLVPVQRRACPCSLAQDTTKRIQHACSTADGGSCVLS